MQSIPLADGGLILFDPAFLPVELADRAFVDLRDGCPWDQKPAAFGHLQPRLTASYGDDGVTYRYSGTVNRAISWRPMLLEIKQRVEAVCGTYNYCLLNRYRDGSDCVGMHADDEPEVGPTIGSVSLGAERTFRVRHRHSGESMRFELPHGSLLIMTGTMQQFWRHGVPRTRRSVGERINLTFRLIQRPVTS